MEEDSQLRQRLNSAIGQISHDIEVRGCRAAVHSHSHMHIWWCLGDIHISFSLALVWSHMMRLPTRLFLDLQGLVQRHGELQQLLDEADEADRAELAKVRWVNWGGVCG
jgi:hypothetical protein